MITIQNLKKYFYDTKTLFGKKKEPLKAVDDISFSVERGKTFGLAGESGCGKTTVAKLIAGILKPDSGIIHTGGEVDIVFQDPFSSLNPRMNTGQIIGEPLVINGINKKEIKDRVSKTLSLVKLGGQDVMKKYPHEFSGGERQRIAIARAIIRNPEIIILDEPVSSLDVSIQATILNLLKDLQEGLSLTYLFISHDLRIIEFMSDTVGIMKNGKILENAPKQNIFNTPQTDYTKHLLSAIPKM
jgi:ABC-type glutathione transport system ATPase component